MLECNCSLPVRCATVLLEQWEVVRKKENKSIVKDKKRNRQKHFNNQLIETLNINT